MLRAREGGPPVRRRSRQIPEQTHRKVQDQRRIRYTLYRTRLR